MTRMKSLFATEIYEAQLSPKLGVRLNAELARAVKSLAADDGAGKRWCRERGYQGYTSYGSLSDLTWRDPSIAELAQYLDKSASVFARKLQFALDGAQLMLDSLWVNLLTPGGGHSGHIHPHSALSGTYYVTAPAGSGAIKFEDPRLPLMMAAPLRQESAAAHRQNFAYIEPRPGLLLMWESWLRHEVMPNRAKLPRISISFNYAVR